MDTETNHYRARFLWPPNDDTPEAYAYEFANALTEEYAQECWEKLKASLVNANTSELVEVGKKILAKLDHPTEPVTMIDAEALRSALGTFSDCDGDRS